MSITTITKYIFKVLFTIALLSGCSVHEVRTQSNAFIGGEEITKWPLIYGGLEVFIYSNNPYYSSVKSKILLISAGNSKSKWSDMPDTKHNIFFRVKAPKGKKITWNINALKLVINGQKIKVTNVVDRYSPTSSCKEMGALDKIVLIDSEMACIDVYFDIDKIHPGNEFDVILDGVSYINKKIEPLIINFKSKTKDTVRF